MIDSTQGTATDHIDTILFDLDGTIIDTHELIRVSMRYTINEVVGLNIPDDQLLAKVGQPLAVQMRDYASSDEEVEELLRIYREHNAIHHDELAREYPGTEATLQALQTAGYTLGIVTSKRHEVALRGLRLFALDRFFPVLVASDDIELHKPDPAPLIYGAELLGRDIARCMYVGDSPFDLQAGNAAGAVTVAALWGMFPEATLRENSPDFVCERLSDLLDILPPRACG